MSVARLGGKQESKVLRQPAVLRSASWGTGTRTRVRLVDVLSLDGVGGVLIGPGLDHAELGAARHIDCWPGASGCLGR